jgi:hypothetical protein
MFGYSLTRPIHNQDWYYGVFDACSKFRCDIEGWHTESGPGVYEAALEYGEIREMADRAALFKLTVKNISSKFGITPCFMAKPRQGLPGNSGHMHVSLVDKDSGANLFARDSPDPNPPYPDVEHLSDLGRHFLAGLLEGLPDIMPIVAPTINSYKRLVENFWAPVTVSWGLEHRAASIRLIAPPTCPPKGTRFEIRVPGADTNGYLVLAAILALGWRGVEKKLELPIPPLNRGQDVGGADDKGERLAKNLKEATARFARKESIAREVFGDEFVEHFAGTREHEIRLWDEAVTDWCVHSLHKFKGLILMLSAGRSRDILRLCKRLWIKRFDFRSMISWRDIVADTVAISASFYIHRSSFHFLNSSTGRGEIHCSIGHVLLSLVDEFRHHGCHPPKQPITLCITLKVSPRFPMPCSTSDRAWIPATMNGRIIRIRLGSIIDLGIIVHLCGPSHHLSDGPDIVQVCTRRHPPHALHCLALPFLIRLSRKVTLYCADCFTKLEILSSIALSSRPVPVVRRCYCCALLAPCLICGLSCASPPQKS